MEHRPGVVTYGNTFMSISQSSIAPVDTDEAPSGDARCFAAGGVVVPGGEA